MSVRLEGFRIRGFGPFDREFAVDLTELAPTDRLVAICGENGAGKTTALELALPGAMFRQTPTRGTLVDLATARDALLETRLVNGQRWTLRHLVDKVSGKSEALVLDADGVPALPDSKVRSFDAWAARHMPAPEVFFASIFAPQGASGFLGAKPGERKEILLRILGPEMQRLELYAEHAREQLKASKATLATLEARIADERARGGDADGLSQLLSGQRILVKSAQARLEAARAAVAAAEEQARQREALAQADQQRAAESARIAFALVTARELVTSREAQVANNRAVLADAEAIRAAAARLPVLRAEIERKRAAVAALDADVRRHADAQQAASHAEAAASQQATRAETRMQGADTVAAAVAKLPELRKALKGAEADLAREEESLAAVRAKSAAGTEARLGLALETLGDIPEVEDLYEVHRLAKARLADDAEQVTLARELPLELKAQGERVALYVTKRRTAEEQLRTAETLAARAPDIAAAREDLAAARTELADAVKRCLVAGEAAATAARERDAAQESLGLLAADHERVEPLALKLSPLEKAEERLAERVPQLEAAKADVARLDAELAALPEAEDLPPAPDVTGAKRSAADAEEDHQRALMQVGGFERALEAAVASRTRQLEIEEQRTTAETELADWTRLASDLGRDGLQAMVIDGAIPEINELTNDLLHAAFGPRFTVEVRTQASDAKGKRLLETLDVWVIDTGTDLHKGREGLAETFSGGEKTILAEAVSLALTKLACRLSGAERPTLIRDESAGQLSEGNAPIWMAMLRRAADIIDVDRILFVNHDRQTWELADARIEVRS